MKSLILNLVVVTLFAFCISCQDDDKQSNSPPAHIELDNAILDNIPSFLQTGTNLVYKTTTGEEWVLTIGFKTDTKTAGQSDHAYTHEQITINAVDLSNNRLIYNTIARGQLDQDLKVVKNITSALRYDLSTITTVGVDVVNNGELIADTFSKDCGNIALGNKEFQRVFNISESFSMSSDDPQMYFNTEFGVVGFTGPTGELWVFDRVQE